MSVFLHDTGHAIIIVSLTISFFELHRSFSLSQTSKVSAHSSGIVVVDVVGAFFELTSSVKNCF